MGGFADTKVASSDEQGAAPDRLGVAVRALTPNEKRQAHLAGGLLVGGVSGPAASAGVLPGDVILAVNGQPVSTLEQLKGSLARAGDSLALLVQRDNARIFIPIDLS
jgi:serine protease Do